MLSPAWFTIIIVFLLVLIIVIGKVIKDKKQQKGRLHFSKKGTYIVLMKEDDFD